MSSLGERIRYAREQKGYLQSELAALIGAKSSGVISNWEKDLNKPDAEKIVKLCDVLDVSASFLLDYYGKSSFEFTASEEDYIKKYRILDSVGREHVDAILQWEIERIKQLEKVEVPATTAPVRLIQYYHRLASAGTGQYVFDNLPTEQIEIPDIPEYKKVRYALGVNGMSMEPDYMHGDILLVEPTQEIEIGEDGIFLHKGNSYVKRLEKGNLHSVNKDFQDIKITEETKCIGKVVGKLDCPVKIPKGSISELIVRANGKNTKRA